MQSPKVWVYILLLTWRIVNCEDDDSDHTVSVVSFTRAREQSDYVDPHSLRYDRANKKMLERHSTTFSASEGVCVSDGQCPNELKQCKDALDRIEYHRLYTVRLINRLLSTARFQEEGDSLSSSITLSGTKEQIDELRGFAEGTTTIQKVDAILSDMMKPAHSILIDTLTFMDHLYKHFYQNTKIYLPVLATLIVLLLIKYVNWSTGKVVIVFLSGAFLLSFFTIWSQLIKEAELKHLVHTIKYPKPPIQCEPEKMSFWDRFVTYFDAHDQCIEYYTAIEFNAFQEITAVDALIELLYRLLFQPVARIGSVFNHFIENSTEHLSLPMKWIITILLYICVPVVFALLILSIFGGRIRVWLGPFCGISIGGGHTSQNHGKLPIIEKREPVIYLSPVILERNSNGELTQLAPATAQSVVENKIALLSSDSKTEKQEATLKNSGSAGDGDFIALTNEATPKNFEAICSSCSCKESLNRSHIQEDKVLTDDQTKSEVWSEEKGDGDC